MQKSKSDSFKFGTKSTVQLSNLVNNITYEDIIKISNVNKANLPTITKNTLDSNHSFKSTGPTETRYTIHSHKYNHPKLMRKRPSSQVSKTHTDIHNSSFVVLFDNKYYFNIVKPLESLNKHLSTKSPINLDCSFEFNLIKKTNTITGLKKSPIRVRNLDKKEVQPDFKFFNIKPQLQKIKPTKVRLDYVLPKGVTFRSTTPKLKVTSRSTTPKLKVTEDSAPSPIPHTPKPVHKIKYSSPNSKSIRKRRKARVPSDISQLVSANITPDVSNFLDNEDIYTVKNLASNITMTPFQELLDLSTSKTAYNYMKTFDKILKSTPKN